MKTLLYLSFIGPVLLCQAYTQAPERAELAKMYVAYFESVTRQKCFEKGDSSLRLKRIERVISPQTVKSHYLVQRDDRRFLNMDIYKVFFPSSHSYPYVVGIDDSLRIYRLSGFAYHCWSDFDDSYNALNDSIPITTANMNHESLKDVILEYFRIIVLHAVRPQNEIQVIINHNPEHISGTCVSKIYSYIEYRFVEVRWKFSIDGHGYVHYLVENSDR
ncbi:hypothetical protein L6Q79_16115 [bacterium]|nr:hypothetical protein [bacterium]